MLLAFMKLYEVLGNGCRINLFKVNIFLFRFKRKLFGWKEFGEVFVGGSRLSFYLLIRNIVDFLISELVVFVGLSGGVNLDVGRNDDFKVLL